MIDNAGLRKRITRAFEAGREDCHASLTVLELVEYVRLTFTRVPSHETLADLGISPRRVYEMIRQGGYRLVFRQEDEWDFLIPSWQPE
jgi:hypothetical protein